MTYLSVDELIEHCNKTLERLPSGTHGYQEHESIRFYLQQLKHFQTLDIPFHMLRDLVESAANGYLTNLSCGVGQTVWILDNRGEVCPFVVEHIDVWEESETYYCKFGNNRYVFDSDEFGGHAFLTKEEAEAAAGKRLMG